MKETWKEKLVASVFMFILTFISTALPIKFIDNKALIALKQRSPESSIRLKRVLRHLNWFAAGVFLATTIVHMLPEVRGGFINISTQLKKDFEINCNESNLTSSQRKSHIILFFLDDFPLAEVIMCLGFFIIMFLEIFLHKISNICQSKNNDTFRRKFNRKFYDALRNKDFDEPCSEISCENNSVNNPENSVDCSSELNYETSSLSVTKNKSITMIGKNSKYDIEPYHLNANTFAPDTKCDKDNIREQVKSTKHRLPFYRNGNSNKEILTNSTSSTFGAIVFLLALIIHSVIEGFALGLVNTSLQLWTLFTAIIIHKTVVATTCGIRLAENFSTAVQKNLNVFYRKNVDDSDSDTGQIETNVNNDDQTDINPNDFRGVSQCKTSHKAYTSAFIFSLSSPFGILLGILISLFQHSNSRSNSLFAVILQGLATGTFLFVSLFEVIFPQLTQAHMELFDSLLCFFGFFLLVLLRLFFKD
ncbi:hypothetical protein HELRODRAFT_172780 [Helobdella robusta]|uniref:Uncharacterized protein n=1 Tax=Helobdella robusta TaxID=6412 RepID=T1F5Y0_HELRO|nr:hypothetical protein HELRODRAFT_172780 [Helobdella robusta]ESO04398.1 hypothetical protein HELRODRAFT_172780 [Helobdella robusta]